MKAALIEAVECWTDAAPDPQRSLPSEGFERALCAVEAALAAGERLVLVSGPTGVGKTLLMRSLAARLRGKSHRLVVPFADVDPDQLARWLLALGGWSEGPEPERTLVGRLAKTTLFVDEAQAMPPATVARLLTLVEGSGPGTRLVLVATAGSQLPPLLSQLPERPHHVVLDVPWGASEIAMLVEQIGERARVPTEALLEAIGVEATLSATQGNPRRIRERVARTLLALELPLVLEWNAGALERKPRAATGPAAAMGLSLVEAKFSGLRTPTLVSSHRLRPQPRASIATSSGGAALGSALHVLPTIAAPPTPLRMSATGPQLHGASLGKALLPAALLAGSVAVTRVRTHSSPASIVSVPGTGSPPVGAGSDRPTASPTAKPRYVPHSRVHTPRERGARVQRGRAFAAGQPLRQWVQGTRAALVRCVLALRYVVTWPGRVVARTGRAVHDTASASVRSVRNAVTRSAAVVAQAARASLHVVTWPARAVARTARNAVAWSDRVVDRSGRALLGAASTSVRSVRNAVARSASVVAQAARASLHVVTWPARAVARTARNAVAWSARVVARSGRALLGAASTSVRSVRNAVARSASVVANAARAARHAVTWPARVAARTARNAVAWSDRVVARSGRALLGAASTSVRSVRNAVARSASVVANAARAARHVVTWPARVAARTARNAVAWSARVVARSGRAVLDTANASAQAVRSALAQSDRTKWRVAAVALVAILAATLLPVLGPSINGGGSVSESPVYLVATAADGIAGEGRVIASLVDPIALARPVGALDAEPVRVNINAMPWADVAIDGRPAGITPLSVLLTPGSHHFVVSKADGQIVDRHIEIAAGRDHLSFR